MSKNINSDLEKKLFKEIDGEFDKHHITDVFYMSL